MNITVLTTDSAPLLGGIADYLHGLMSSTVGEIQWDLRTTVSGSPEFDQSLSYPVHRFSIAPRNLGQHFGDEFVLFRKFNTLLWLAAKRRRSHAVVKEIIEENNPDVILIARWTRDAHGWCRACREFGIPYIIIAYGLEMVRPLSVSLSSGRKNDLAGAALVFADSRRVAEIVRDMSNSASPVLVMNPGVDLDRMGVVSAESATDELKNMGIDGKFILCLGRVVYRKGFDLAVKVFDLLAENHPDISLVIAGEGEYSRKVMISAEKSQFSERIIMTGRVSDMQRKVLFQECEFYVMPNRPVKGDIEGFGIVFLQANCYGKAVIGGNNGGVPDAILHEKTGLLTDTPVIEPLSQAMTRLLDDSDFADALGAAGRARVAKEFQWKTLSRIFIRGIEKYVDV